jgi:hypothetical protein
VLSTLTLFRAGLSGSIAGWPTRYACGLNVDSAGLSARADNPMNFSRPPAGLPTLAGRLVADLLAAAKARAPWFTWREALMTNDNVMLSDPMLGCPCALLGHQHTVAYHTDGDTPEILDAETIRLITAVIAAFAYRAASAPEEEVTRQGPVREPPAEWGARADLRRVARRRVWGPLFRSARLLPPPYDSWFEWNTRGLVPLYQLDGRRALAEAFHRAAVPPAEIDQYLALTRALADAGIIEFL